MRMKEKICLGWREWVSLPELGVKAIKAKIDSGAKTSALHASYIRILSRHGKKMAKFIIHPKQDSSQIGISAKATLIGHKSIKSSIGHTTIRPMIKTILVIGEKRIPIEMTLVNRDLMGFRMLIGRQAIRKGFLIHPGKSFLVSKKRK